MDAINDMSSDTPTVRGKRAGQRLCDAINAAPSRHSPVPWKVRDTLDPKSNYVVVDALGGNVASCSVFSDAMFIVACANAWQAEKEKQTIVLGGGEDLSKVFSPLGAIDLNKVTVGDTDAAYPHTEIEGAMPQIGMVPSRTPGLGHIGDVRTPDLQSQITKLTRQRDELLAACKATVVMGEQEATGHGLLLSDRAQAVMNQLRAAIANSAPPSPTARCPMLDLTKYEGHTPGPWRYQEEITSEMGGASIHKWEIYTGGSKYGHPATCERERDAALIASAPDLLAELREARKAMRRVVDAFRAAERTNKYDENILQDFAESCGVCPLEDCLARVKDGDA